MDDTPGNEGAKIACGVLTDISGCWFLLTAGHVLEAIETANKKGQHLHSFSLGDTYSRTAASPWSLPFDYEKATKWWVHSEKTGDDLGLIFLDPYRAQLEKHGGVQPLGADGWSVNPDQDADGYYLVGVPHESVGAPTERHEGPVSVAVRLIGYPLIRVGEPCAQLQREGPFFFGKLVDDPNRPLAAKSIRGMSGAPIFGLKQLEPGHVQYWLVAVQSSWHPSEREIRGCLTAGRLTNVADAVKRLLEDAVRNAIGKHGAATRV
jgi:hypothetical protein